MKNQNTVKSALSFFQHGQNIYRNQWVIVTVVFLLSFIFFYRIQFSSPAIPGFDGYYHIKMAEIIREQGLIKNFPWLQFPFEKGRFVDHHFLFHILLIPFIYFWDLMNSAKIATVVFNALMTTMLALLLHRSGVKGSLIWVAIFLASSTPFLYRMSLPRVGSLSLSLLFLSCLFLRENRHLWLGLTAFFLSGFMEVSPLFWPWDYSGSQVISV